MGQPRFVAFDLLHSDGQDLTYSPLIERKTPVSKESFPTLPDGDFERRFIDK